VVGGFSREKHKAGKVVQVKKINGERRGEIGI